MRDLRRIKQIMPLPEDRVVLVRMMSDDKTEAFEDISRLGAFKYCMALVDGDEWNDDYVGIYEVDNSGYGEIVEEAYLIRRMKCNSCGEEMYPKMKVGNPSSLTYFCHCGNCYKEENPEALKLEQYSKEENYDI